MSEERRWGQKGDAWLPIHPIAPRLERMRARVSTVSTGRYRGQNLITVSVIILQRLMVAPLGDRTAGKKVENKM